MYFSDWACYSPAAFSEVSVFVLGHPHSAAFAKIHCPEHSLWSLILFGGVSSYSSLADILFVALLES